MNVGDRILLNDGKIEMVVDSVAPNRVEATVVRGTEIWSRRGFNLPDTEISTSVLTVKDRTDLAYAVTKNPDYVAISFVQRPEDVAEVRDFISQHTSHPIKIIAKIDTNKAVNTGWRVLINDEIITDLYFLHTLIEERLGKIIRLEIKRAPIILIPITTVIAVSTARTML